MEQDNNFVILTYPYIGGYIRYYLSKGNWPKKRMEKWERYIIALIKTADEYP